MIPQTISHQPSFTRPHSQLVVLWVITAIEPFNRRDWLLENLLVFIYGVLLVVTYRRFAFSNLSYMLFGMFSGWKTDAASIITGIPLTPADVVISPFWPTSDLGDSTLDPNGDYGDNVFGETCPPLIRHQIIDMYNRGIDPTFKVTTDLPPVPTRGTSGPWKFRPLNQ